MAFQFKIQLADLDEPPVWRTVLVQEHYSFLQLHYIIQEAFGWENAHMFQFSPNGYGSEPVIGMAGYEDMEEVLDCGEILLSAIFKKAKQKYVYIYDFGDDWTHLITLEKITADKITKASCIDGGGACPPEDCGGPWGYINLLEILNDPKHPEHRDMKEWLGLSKTRKWDAAAFDLKKANSAVGKI